MTALHLRTCGIGLLGGLPSETLDRSYHRLMRAIAYGRSMSLVPCSTWPLYRRSSVVLRSSDARRLLRVAASMRDGVCGAELHRRMASVTVDICSA